GDLGPAGASERRQCRVPCRRRTALAPAPSTVRFSLPDTGEPDARGRRRCLRPAIDPRRGDIEDDASSSKRRSLLSLAGSLLAEISLPKLVVAFTLLVVIASCALGMAQIVADIWFVKLSIKLANDFKNFRIT